VENSDLSESLSRYVYPTVRSESQRDRWVIWMNEHRLTHPITYVVSESKPYSIPTIVQCLAQRLDSNVASLVHQITVKFPEFHRLTPDVQEAEIKKLLPIPIPTTPALHPDEIRAIETIISGFRAVSVPLPIASWTTPVGTRPFRVRTVEEWDGTGLDELFKELTFTRDDFTCPLSQEILVDPVAYGGHIYERGYITHWIGINPSSPLTRRTHDDAGVPYTITAPPALFVSQLAEWKRMNPSEE
jgi:hypothetical protein